MQCPLSSPREEEKATLILRRTHRLRGSGRASYQPAVVLRKGWGTRPANVRSRKRTCAVHCARARSGHPISPLALFETTVETYDHRLGTNPLFEHPRPGGVAVWPRSCGYCGTRAVVVKNHGVSFAAALDGDQQLIRFELLAKPMHDRRLSMRRNFLNHCCRLGIPIAR